MLGEESLFVYLLDRSSVLDVLGERNRSHKIHLHGWWVRLIGKPLLIFMRWVHAPFMMRGLEIMSSDDNDRSRRNCTLCFIKLMAINLQPQSARNPNSRRDTIFDCYIPRREGEKRCFCYFNALDVLFICTNNNSNRCTRSLEISWSKKLHGKRRINVFERSR